MQEALLQRLVRQAHTLFQSLPSHPCRAQLHNQARLALLDWVGVCIGGSQEPAGQNLLALTDLAPGPVRTLNGHLLSAADAAWLHGTLSHLLDFDDTHVGSILHTSGPVWAALWSAGQQGRTPASVLLDAFIVSFQFGARLGIQGRGERLTGNGWHVTPVLGRLAGALAVALARNLTPEQTVHAIALAATSAAGLTVSFGSLAKPLHAGFAARDSVFCAALARSGATGSPRILDAPTGLFNTLLQDRTLTIDIDLSAHPWEIEHNSFKPYASCQLTHASLDAARMLATGAPPQGEVVAHVHPLAIQIAGTAQAATDAQAKFSLPYCIALGLAGYRGTWQDFHAERRDDPLIHDWMQRVQLQPDPHATRESAWIQHTVGTDVRIHKIEAATGSTANPMSETMLRAKFDDLATPCLGASSQELQRLLTRFGVSTSLEQITDFLDTNLLRNDSPESKNIRKTDIQEQQNRQSNSY